MIRQQPETLTGVPLPDVSVLRAHGRLQLSYVMTSTRHTSLAEVLYTAASDGRHAWTPQEWEALLARLRAFEGTLDDWLDLNT